MKTIGKRPTRELGQALPVIRGLLAKPSDSEDDPWHRVILTKSPTSVRRGLTVTGLLSSDSAEALRGKIKTMLDTQFPGRSSRPVGVNIQGFGSFQVSATPIRDLSPLENKVALVTGAAGAIGAGICRLLLKKGCRVVATDVMPDRLNILVKELARNARGRIAGVTMDVTDKASVAEGFAQAACAWGGVDIVVVNAGIAMVAPLMEMDLEAFRRLEKVNIEGTLLTLAEAGRSMVRQGTGGDIVLISTKNVFAPGAQFGAYSATKAASHQLARIASLEFASFDIRVNMVAPDAVFSEGTRKSGLWAEIGPSRMKARGLDEKGLEEYYRSRNLLKARVTATHVANAVLFLATRQTPTTGATIPVDGGLPDAAPR
ncbi:MAG: SDR family NAD(P)-dependent oxidoreductase [bacterium]